MSENFLKDLFINEARPALDKFKGAGSDNDDLLLSIIDRSVTSFSNDRLTTVGQYSFQRCDKMTEVDLPLVTYVGNYGFAYCSSLVEVSIPNLTSIGNCILLGCDSLESITLPLVQGLTTSTFNSCEALKKADFSTISAIANTTFNGCKLFTTLIIRRSRSITILNTVDAFKGTPFASGGTGGTVYVPQALIEEYKVATNWSTLYAAGTCNFAPIEGSEYE